MRYKYIGFKALGWDYKGRQYDCSFYVSFPFVQGIKQEDVQTAVNSAVAEFHRLHPTGQIIHHLEVVR